MKLLLVLVFLAVEACGFSNAPIQNTPAPGEPCGHVQYQCGDGSCCAYGNVCGGRPFSGCPADSCCFAGGGDGAMGTRRTSPKYWPGRQ